MNVQLFLDRPRNHFTNLDDVTGKVVLKASRAESITNVTVKLQGESRTRLMSPVRAVHNERPRPVLEVHKLLYKTAIIWPPGALSNEHQRAFTILAGIHEYPFNFKIPFNNACNLTNSLQTNANFMGLSIEFGRTPTQHVKTILPPSLYFPGEAEVKYYVKATVKRPQLYKENPRSIVSFNFCPIESPRPSSDGETYARRQHQFQAPAAFANADGHRPTFPNIFRKVTGNSLAPSTPSSSTEAPASPRFSVDARLPNPAILTCSKPIPLRILVEQLTPRNLPLYLQSIHVELIGYTHIRAHEVHRRQSNSWVICSKASINIPLGSAGDPVGTASEISDEYWKSTPLPSSVAPTFTTCNMRREYELDIRVGLGYGGEKSGQFTVLPLRLPLKVLSGITPSPDLLAALEASLNSDTARPPTLPTRRPSSTNAASNSGLPEYGAESAGPGSSQTPHGGPHYDDAPPSYEDAIADDLPAINGPRPDYEPPPAPADGESGSLGKSDETRTGRFGF